MGAAGCLANKTLAENNRTSSQWGSGPPDNNPGRGKLLARQKKVAGQPLQHRVDFSLNKSKET
eukprot:10851195-Lingulodinium_polyedra.AAC.1